MSKGFHDPGESEVLAMKYLCMVWFEEKTLAALSIDDGRALDRDSFAYDEELRTRGYFIVAQALQPAKKAKIVRVRNGKVSTIDGPFAETKEQLGGFILIEAKDMSDALKVAAKIPLARLGSIEVRPIMELNVDRREKRAGMKHA